MPLSDFKALFRSNFTTKLETKLITKFLENGQLWYEKDNVKIGNSPIDLLDTTLDSLVKSILTF
jgi:hypothetical protein